MSEGVNETGLFSAYYPRNTITGKRRWILN